MQLPRGTFREIRKSVAVESLLNALDGEKFSGIANISSPSLTGTLVFKAGKCILVKIRNSRGDTGWDEIQKAGNEEVDAALSLLDDAQIGLALEFNKPCRILKSGKHAPALASHRPACAIASHAPPQDCSWHRRPQPPLHRCNILAKPAPTPHHVPAPPSAPQALCKYPAAAPAPVFQTRSARFPRHPLVPASRPEEKQRPEDGGTARKRP